MQARIPVLFWLTASCVWLAGCENSDKQNHNSALNSSLAEDAEEQFVISLQRIDSLRENGLSDEAYQLADSMCQLSLKMGDLSAQALSWQSLADVYYFDDELDSALIYFNRALQTAKEAGNKELEIDILIDIAWMKTDLNEMDSVHLLGIDAYKKAEDLNLPYLELEAGRLLGSMFYSVGNYPLAKDYLQKAANLEIPDSMQTPYSQRIKALVYDAYGGVLGELKEFKEARKAYAKADSIYRVIGEVSERYILIYGLGYIDIYEGFYSSGIQKCHEALEFFSSSDNQYYIEGCMECLSRGYFLSGQYDSALYYLKATEASIQESGHFYFKTDIYELLAKTYDQLGLYKEAFQYHQLFKAFSDSIIRLDQKSNISILESKFRYEKLMEEKEALQEFAKRDYAVIESQRKANALITLALMLVAAIAGLLGYLFNIHSQRNKTLAEEVAKRTEELSVTNTSLLMANQELEEFTYISSHDLREPIRNINSFSALIRRKQDSLTTQELSDYLKIIEFNALQLQELVKAIHDYTGANQGDITFTTFSTKDIIQDILSVLSEPIQSKCVHIDLQIDPDQITTNRGLLFLVLRNLIDNGIKYNNSNSPELTIGCLDHPAYYQWFVRDNGIGISAEYHQRVFEMFRRLHPRDAYQGSGLGLSICRKIIHRLGGELRLKSEPGKGSEFWFTLPKTTNPK